MAKIAEKPCVLVLSGLNRFRSENIAKYYASLGADVMIAFIQIEDNRVIVEDLNQDGVKYASITSEVADEHEAIEVMYRYLGDSPNFNVVINLTDRAEPQKIIDMLNPHGGVLYTCASA